jgi:hypothetical protein
MFSNQGMRSCRLSEDRRAMKFERFENMNSRFKVANTMSKSVELRSANKWSRDEYMCREKLFSTSIVENPSARNSNSFCCIKKMKVLSGRHCRHIHELASILTFGSLYESQANDHEFGCCVITASSKIPSSTSRISIQWYNSDFPKCHESIFRSSLRSSSLEQDFSL